MKNLALKITGLAIYALAVILLAFAIIRTVDLF